MQSSPKYDLLYRAVLPDVLASDLLSSVHVVILCTVLRHANYHHIAQVHSDALNQAELSSAPSVGGDKLEMESCDLWFTVNQLSLSSKNGKIVI